MSSPDEQIDPQDKTQLTAGGSPVAGEFGPGDIVGGSYQVLSLIGTGGMGNVYRVRHTIMHTEYALKTLSAEKVTEEAWLRFQNEAQAIARMNHPNVVAIYNLGFHQNHLPYYVMDIIRGRTLSDILKDKGQLDTNEALKLFIEVCTGISYAHKKGIVHRDLKPPNIILMDSTDATGATVKIVDFGIARLSNSKALVDQQLTKAGEVCGSPYYMSPEQCDAGKIDARSDIYSLGCTLFEALTGSPPFKGRNAMETMLLHHTGIPPTLKAASAGKEFPEMLERAIAKTLAKAPMDRYQTMDSLAQDLSDVLAGKETSFMAPVKTRQIQADRTEQKEPDPTKIREEKSVQMEPESHVKRLAPAAALATVLSLSAAGIWWISFNARAGQVKNNKAVATTGATINSDHSTKGSAYVFDSQPFSTVLPKADGNKIILFNFPTNESIGQIQLDEEQKSFDCQGNVELPYGHKLIFTAAPPCFTHLQYLDRLRFNDFDTIRLQSLMTFEQAKNSAVEHLAHLKELAGLIIFDCDSIDDGAVPYMANLKKLQRLELEMTNITGAGLAQSPILRQLKFFSMQTKDSVSPLLKTLQGSKAMEHLKFHDTPLTHSDYKLIASMTNLKWFEAPGCEMHNEDLASISALNRIEILNLAGSYVDEKSIPHLTKMQAHGLRRLHMASPHLTDQAFAAIQKALPDVHFE